MKTQTSSPNVHEIFKKFTIFFSLFNEKKNVKKIFLTIIIFLLTSLFFVMTSLIIETEALHNSTVSELILEAEEIIEKNVINIKSNRIQPVFKGDERVIGKVVEIVEEEKVIRKYPNLIQIFEDNESVVIHGSRIKIVE